MQKLKAIKIARFILFIVGGNLAGVLYALVYREKWEVTYTNTVKIDRNEVKCWGFNLLAPAGSFEIKLTVLKGNII